jgi:hypothetical protein
MREKRNIASIAIALQLLLFALNPAHAGDGKDGMWNAFWNRIVYQYEITVDYWSPIVKETADKTVEYWAPIVKETKDQTIEYWAPIVKETKETTIEYWTPRLEKGMLYFADHILPKIRSAYKAYMDGPGEEISRNFMISWDWFTANVSESVIIANEYYKTRYPIQYRYVTDVPAFVKIGYEKFILSIWGFLDSLEEEELDGISQKHASSLNMALNAARALRDRKETADNMLLTKLLNDLRPHVTDYGMQDCYLATLFEGEIMNAFNLGCNIFVSKDLMELLNMDPRLIRAVIAHEIGHGDKGHGIKTMGTLLGTGVKHFADLTMQELVWLATGDVHDLFARVANGESNGDLIMERFAPTAPALEIEADIHAAAILENAGYDKKDLIDALKLLHQVSGTMDCDQERLTGGNRDYPTFCARRDAILAVD